MSKTQAVVCILLVFSSVCFAQDSSYINIMQNVMRLMQGTKSDNLDTAALANFLTQINQTTVLKSLMSVLTQNKNSASNAKLSDLNGFTNLPEILGSLSNIPYINGVVKNFLKSESLSLGLQKITDLLSTQFDNNEQLLVSLSKLQSLVGILELPYQISERCSSHMMQVVLALMNGQEMAQNMWALKMIDSMGKIPVGILRGNLKSLGSFDECRRVKASILDHTNHTTSPFNGKYCTITVPVYSLLADYLKEGLAGIQSPMIQDAQDFIAFAAGLCLPDSCSDSDALVMFNKVLYLIKSQIPNTNVSVFATAADCHENERELDNNAICALIVCAFFAALMAGGTAYDLMYIQWPNKKVTSGSTSTHEKSKNEIKGCNEPKADTTTTDEVKSKLEYPSSNLKMESEDTKQAISDNPAIQTENHDSKLVKESQNVNYQPGLAGKLVLAFSVYTNGKKLLNTHQASETIASLNGIRFLSLSWVILGHTYVFLLPVAENITAYVEFLDRWTFYAVVNGLVSVDTFFALSGFLMSYLILKEMKKRKGVCGINWFLFYFHRIWRLTPAYMLILFIYVTTFPYWNDGPMWNKNGVERNYCADSWWQNLLYINNLYKPEKICFVWSWYLACDMQFYILSPLLFIPLFYNVFVGIVVCGMFLIATMVTTGVISSMNNLPPHGFGGSENADILSYWSDYYFKPYCRIGPYVVGILAGYLMYKTKCKLRIHWILNICIWLFFTGVACAILYGLYDSLGGINLLSVEVSAFYNATHRTAWGCCVCWVIVSCATGNGGFVNTLLSWKGFVPLARLTYCAYLIHPCLIYLYYYSLRQPLHVTDITIIYLFLGHLVVSYMVAFVLSLTFESPLMCWEKLIFRPRRKKETKSNKEIPQVVKSIS